MSKYERDFFRYILQNPQRRGISIMSKSLWKRSIFSNRLFFVYLFHITAFFTLFSGAVISYMYLFKDMKMNGGIAILIVFGPAILAIIMILIYYIIQNKSRSLIDERPIVDINEFIADSSRIQKYDKGHIKVIREILGYIYCVDPRIIYINDTADSLRKLGNLNDPFGFELVVGVLKKLDISISDKEINRIIKKIHNVANNVEDLVGLLSEEIILAKYKSRRGN